MAVRVNLEPTRRLMTAAPDVLRLKTMAQLKRLPIWLGLKKDPRTIPKHASVGRETFGVHRASFLNCTADTPVEIGAFCSVGPDALFLCEADHPIRTASSFPLQSRIFRSKTNQQYLTSKGPIRVGHDVWIGARAIILSGVTIGHGAVVAAGGVVARDVPPYAIVAGNPARHVKWRFDEETVRGLLEIEWWNWPMEKILRERAAFDLPAGDFVRRFSTV